MIHDCLRPSIIKLLTIQQLVQLVLNDSCYWPLKIFYPINWGIVIMHKLCLIIFCLHLMEPTWIRSIRLSILIFHIKEKFSFHFNLSSENQFYCLTNWRRQRQRRQWRRLDTGVGRSQPSRRKQFVLVFKVSIKYLATKSDTTVTSTSVKNWMIPSSDMGTKCLFLECLAFLWMTLWR